MFGNTCLVYRYTHSYSITIFTLVLQKFCYKLKNIFGFRFEMEINIDRGPGIGFQKETQAQMFSCELCEILRTPFEIDGSSRPKMFCKKGVLRNFTKFTGKHLCQSLLFNKVAGLRLLSSIVDPASV